MIINILHETKHIKCIVHTRESLEYGDTFVMQKFIISMKIPNFCAKIDVYLKIRHN